MEGVRLMAEPPQEGKRRFRVAAWSFLVIVAMWVISIVVGVDNNQVTKHIGEYGILASVIASLVWIVAFVILARQWVDEQTDGGTKDLNWSWHWPRRGDDNRN